VSTRFRNLKSAQRYRSSTSAIEFADLLQHAMNMREKWFSPQVCVTESVSALRGSGEMGRCARNAACVLGTALSRKKAILRATRNAVVLLSILSSVKMPPSVNADALMATNPWVMR
jgi:hypothetical protein